MLSDSLSERDGLALPDEVGEGVSAEVGVSSAADNEAVSEAVSEAVKLLLSVPL